MLSGLLHNIYISDMKTILITIPIVVLVWSVIGAISYKYMRFVGAIFAVVSVLVILYVTVFARNGSKIGLELVPLSSFEKAKIQPEFYRSMLMNVVFFLPLGLALPYIVGGGVGKRILITILIGFMLSVSVEAGQYFAAVGLSETDDVICNTLGAAIGSCAYPLSPLWKINIMKLKNKNALDNAGRKEDNA